MGVEFIRIVVYKLRMLESAVLLISFFCIFVRHELYLPQKTSHRSRHGVVTGISLLTRFGDHLLGLCFHWLHFEAEFPDLMSLEYCDKHILLKTDVIYINLNLSNDGVQYWC